MKKQILILFIVLTATAFGQTNKRTSQFNLENGLAIQGYDPVAYFSQKKAIKGKSTLTAVHEGVTYQFSSQTNKDAFLKNPSGYEPQYGGWCAFAMGDYGKKVEVDPETFKILDGKLNFFTMLISIIRSKVGTKTKPT